MAIQILDLDDYTNADVREYITTQFGYDEDTTWDLTAITNQFLDLIDTNCPTGYTFDAESRTLTYPAHHSLLDALDTFRTFWLESISQVTVLVSGTPDQYTPAYDTTEECYA